MTEQYLPGGIRFIRRPSTSGRRLLFLHGFLGSADEWRPIVRALGEGDAICLDLPGHGASDGCDRALYSFGGTVTMIDAAVDRLGGDVDLIGYSMGGRIALHYAFSRQDRVRSLVLESASPGIEDETERRERIAVDRTRSEQLLHLGLDSFMRGWYRQPLFESLVQRPDLLADVLDRRGRASAEAVARALEAFSPGRQPSLWPRLAELAPRVTFVAGALDEKYVRIGHEVIRKVPDADLRVVPGAGHNVHLEQPQRFIDILNNHLNE